MRSRLLIRLDLLLGFPLCLAAFLVSLPVRLLRRRSRAPVRRILVIKFLGLGSVLLATPMVRRLRALYPDAHIAFLTFDTNAELVGRMSVVDEVIVVPRRRAMDLARALPGIFWKLRRDRVDLAIDLEFYSRLSNVFSWAIGARRRIGFFVRARWRGSLLTDAIYFNSTLPFGQAVMALLRPLGPQAAADAETECTQLEVPAVTEDEATASWRRLIAQGMPALGTFVVVNVNASDLCVERRWPADRFASLVNRFGSEISPVDRYVFIGSGSETDVVAEVMLHLDPSVRSRSVDLAGRTSLSDLVVLLSRSSLVITNDSGPLHLAAALDVPSVSFFGPETPKLYGPVGDQHLVFYSGHWCSPCLSVYNAKIAMCAGENECMRRIGLDDVIARTATFCRDRLGMPRPTHPVTTEPGPAEVSPAEAAP